MSNLLLALQLVLDRIEVHAERESVLHRLGGDDGVSALVHSKTNEFIG